MSLKSVRRFCLILFGLHLAMLCQTGSAQAINWNGTWSGSYIDEHVPDQGCILTNAGNIRLDVAVTNGSVTGTGSIDGLACVNSVGCVPNPSVGGSGKLTGTVSGNTIRVSFGAVITGGLCAGTQSIGLSGTLIGNTITGPFGNGKTNGFQLTGGSYSPIIQTNKCLGKYSSPSQPAGGDPIRIGTGNMFHEVLDYTTAGPNPLSFSRYYNSIATADLNIILYANEGQFISLGGQWHSTYDRSLFIISSGGVPVSVIAHRADGQEFTFTSSGTNWTTDSDVDIKLAQAGSAWMLTNTDDSVEVYSGSSAIALLRAVQARNGYTQTLQYDGSGNVALVTDSFGRMLQFSYQGNRLQSLTTPEGRTLTYAYVGASGLLASVTYPTVHQTSKHYLYEDGNWPSALTGIIDENGNRFATWTYDDETGRAVTSQLGSNAYPTTVYYNDTDGSRLLIEPLGMQMLYKFTTLYGVPKVTEIDRLETPTTPAAQMSYIYDNNGYVTVATDWNTIITSTLNDVHGQPTNIIEAVGTALSRTTTISYDTNFHLPIKIIAPRKTTAFIYDTNGNPLTVTETDTSTGTTPYSTSGQTSSWTNTFDNFGHLLTTTGPRNDLVATTSFSYDATNNLSTVTDALGHVTILTNYNGSGLPLTMIDPNGVVTALTYDERDRLLTRTVLAADGNTTNSFTYDGVGQLSAITLPNRQRLNYQFDPAHRLQSVTNSLGESILYSLDALGDITNQIILSANSTIVKTQSAAFDQLGRMLQQIGAALQTTTYGYDPDDNRISISDGLTNKTEQAFDALNRLITITDPLTKKTSLAYTTADNLATVTDPRSLVTSYYNDGFGQVIGENSPDKGITTYRLDKAGNRTNEVDARNIVTQRTFDKLNRPISETFLASATENISFSYDSTNGGNFGIGRLTGYTDETGSTTLTYNERGDVISTTRIIAGTAFITGYGYDLADHMTSVAYPSGHIINYWRDSQGRISIVTYRPSSSGIETVLASGVHYLPFGPLTGLTYGNGLVRAQNYDEDYRLTNITTLGTVSVQNLALTFDAVNDITTIADRIASPYNQTFIYDQKYRLTNAIGIYGNTTFTYDANDNRQTRSFAGITETYNYPTTVNRLSSITKPGYARSFAYTPNGNASSDNRGTTTGFVFAYSNRDRYKTLTSNGTTVATYKYNALNERLIKTVGSTTTVFHYGQAGHLIAESQPNGTLIREYIWLDDMPLAQIESSGAIYYIHPDHLGRPQKMTDAAQNVVWDNEQQPFGEAMPPTLAPLGYNAIGQFQMVVVGSVNYSYTIQGSTSLNGANWVSLSTNAGPFTFTDANASHFAARFYRMLYVTNSSANSVTQNLRFPGQYFDAESGLNYNMNRDYDPSLGRYIESDSIGLRGEINLYGYAKGNPLVYIDSNGHFVIGVLIGGVYGGISGALAANMQPGSSASDLFFGGLTGAVLGGATGLIDPSEGALTMTRLAIIGGASGVFGDLAGQYFGGKGCYNLKETIGAGLGGVLGGGLSAGLTAFGTPILGEWLANIYGGAFGLAPSTFGGFVGSQLQAPASDAGDHILKLTITPNQ